MPSVAVWFSVSIHQPASSDADVGNLARDQSPSDGNTPFRTVGDSAGDLKARFLWEVG